MAVIYDVYVEPEAHSVRRQLPGNVRQQIGRIIGGLDLEPRPPESQQLYAEELSLPQDTEIWRVRIGRWRIVYAINDVEQRVWVLGIYRRPPYDYSDLSALVGRIN